MELLERKTYLDDLRGFLTQATRGYGCMLFLGGEAGVGKSSLVQAFARSVDGRARVLTGACDPLSTPRPLGPILDISDTLGPEISTLIRTSAPQFELFRSILAELRKNSPSVVVIEDAHWADEATLDLLRYLGRRMADVPALIVVTYRDDEVGLDHPLRRVAGELAAQPAVRRMALRPLSQTAVAQLATGSNFDAVELFELTDGNPFFVTEVISVGEVGTTGNGARRGVGARGTPLSGCADGAGCQRSHRLAHRIVAAGGARIRRQTRLQSASPAGCCSLVDRRWHFGTSSPGRRYWTQSRQSRAASSTAGYWPRCERGRRWMRPASRIMPKKRTMAKRCSSFQLPPRSRRHPPVRIGKPRRNTIEHCASRPICRRNFEPTCSSVKRVSTTSQANRWKRWSR